MVDDQAEPAPQRCVSVALVGPLPPPFGGMANQTEQLARLLRASGLSVDVIQVNMPYRPSWVGHLWGVRALLRLLPYLWQLWNRVGRVELVHVMANSDWAWHLFAAPAVWVARLRSVPVIVNYRGGEARSFMEKQYRWIRPTLRLANVVAVPSGFLQAVFSKWDVQTNIVPNIIDLSRFSPGVLEASRLHVLVSRNLEDIYDIPTAIAAFCLISHRHPHARLSIAGSGPRRTDLEEQCRRLGLQSGVYRCAYGQAAAKKLFLAKSAGQLAADFIGKIIPRRQGGAECRKIAVLNGQQRLRGRGFGNCRRDIAIVRHSI